MQGRIVQISVSPGGLPKRAVPEGMVTPLGIEGDRHAHPSIHGGPNKALLLVSFEDLEALVARGYPVFPGALGENLTILGIDFRKLRVGDQLRAGGSTLEITQPRGPCAALDVYGAGIKEEIYDRAVKALDVRSPRWGKSGFYARVLVPGWAHPDDIIALVATLA